jgi:hypothetical protein
MLIATSTAAALRQPTMKSGAPDPSNTAIDSIDQENFKAW